MKDKTSIEDLHNESNAILSQKQAEIEELRESIHNAEEELRTLVLSVNQVETLFMNLEDKAKKSREILDHNDNDSFLHENEEIAQIKLKNDEEYNTLKAQFAKSLEDSGKWIEKHLEIVKMEKKIQLEEAQKELIHMKSLTNETKLISSSKKSMFSQDAKSVSIMNSQRAQFLETQLSELSSIMREEMREIRSKIDECLSSIDIRQLEYQNEYARYEKEIQEREGKYQAHLQSLVDTYEEEKKKYGVLITAAQSKAEGMEKMIKQLEKKNNYQTNVTMKDFEKLKSTIYSTRINNESMKNERQTGIKEYHDTEKECYEMEYEIKIIQNEIDELSDENLKMKNKIAEIEAIVYRK